MFYKQDSFLTSSLYSDYLILQTERSAFSPLTYMLLVSIESSPFTGTFDGNGHVIKNFTVQSNAGATDSTISLPSALFGTVGDGAVIKNLGMVGTTVQVNHEYLAVAALVAKASGNVTLENCFLRNTNYVCNGSTPGRVFSGGFVCMADNAVLTFKNCYATGTNGIII